jgi:hypothetical protein
MVKRNKGDTIMAKRKSPIREMIDKSLQDLHGSAFEQDPTLEDDEQNLSGPARFAKGQQKKDEVIIDSQLADISGKEGYFLKLKKELRPNEWMLMKTIETDWRRWPDVETEVAKIVKEHTKMAPSKWGSGPYRIEYACKGGMRGKSYPTLDFYINAEEEFLTNTATAQATVIQPVDASVAVAGQIDTLANLVGMLKNFLPQATDPAKTQEQIAGAFEKGLAIKATEGSSNNQMMMTMMTGLMGMMTAMATNNRQEPRVVNAKEELSGMLDTLKTFGVLGSADKDKPKSFADTLLELKAIGLDIFKKEDPLEQVGKLKQIASIAAEFMGMGGTPDKPSILEKCVDMLVPALPEMVKQISSAANSAVQAQVEAGKNIERAKITVSNPTTVQQHEGTQMHTASNTQPTQAAVNPQVIAFFNGLYDSVKSNNRMYYPIVYTSLLGDPKGIELVNGIVAGTHTAKELVEMLQGFGDARFKDSEFVMKHLVSYVNGFIIWLRDMVKPKSFEQVAQENPAPIANVVPKGPGYDVECGVCHTVYVYANAQEFSEEENKVCGNNGCIGVIQPLVKAS